MNYNLVYKYILYAIAICSIVHNILNHNSYISYKKLQTYLIKMNDLSSKDIHEVFQFVIRTDNR